MSRGSSVVGAIGDVASRDAHTSETRMSHPVTPRGGRHRIITGIQPSGIPHVGNLKGMIEPSIALQQEGHEVLYFVASYHALTSVRDAGALRQYQREAVLTLLAFGADPNAIFLQEDVPEVLELAWVIGCRTGVGVLERSHAAKAAKDAGRDVSLGLLSYPVLMTADILAYDVDLVSVGQDQVSHVEVARDVAQSFNHRHPGLFRMPEAKIKAGCGTVLGLDGRKMSKSYKNTIEVFDDGAVLQEKIKRIKTSSESLQEPKNPDTCAVYNLYRLFATPDEVAEMRRRYEAGGYGYGHAKIELFKVMTRELEQPRLRYESYRSSPERVEEILFNGAKRAREHAARTLSSVRKAVGLSGLWSFGP